MKKVAILIATAALATAAAAQDVNNWRNASGEVWKTLPVNAGAMPVGRLPLPPKTVMALWPQHLLQPQ